MTQPRLISATFVLSTALSFAATHAEEPAASDSGAQAPGHSMHSQTFNEGPRQAGYLMAGMGNTRFPISTKNPMAQRFFDQGIAQLHGFWYFEAERSFRQAAAFDPDHPMHYWGMARANIENRERSLGFIELAMKRLEKANTKEKKLIESWNKRVQPLDADKKEKEKQADGAQSGGKPESNAAKRARLRNDSQRKKQEQERLKEYVASLEQLASDYPEDTELKAMLVLQIWQNNGAGIEIQSHMAVDSMLSDIFRTNTRHPAHHFRIHLWDYKKEKLALDAAANCGPSAPGIAHMWHMPGHTYTRLHRYADAAWQQEASARVDHAHMMRDHLLPDQIHNYAHNNEWLIRSLNLIGRVDQAIEVAKNMIELPRHPGFNMLGESGSANYGRERLIQTLTNYERWQQLLDLCATQYLNATGKPNLDDERLAWMTIAAVHTGKTDIASKHKQALLALKASLLAATKTDGTVLAGMEASDRTSDDDAKRPQPPTLLEPYSVQEDPFGDENDPSLPKPMSKDWKEPADKKWSQERKDLEKKQHENLYRLQRIGFWLNAIEAHELAAKGDFGGALRVSHLARPVVPPLVRMEWLARSSPTEKALERLVKKAKDGSGELLPIALAAYYASQIPSKEKIAKELLESLAPIAFGADKGLKILERLAPAIDRLGMRSKWDEKPAKPTDTGDRPPLDSLGPLRWTPWSVPMWYGTDANGNTVADKQFSGKPYIAILYLGFGCLHCAEQLAEFSPKVEQFDKLDIEVIGISTENQIQLRDGLKAYDKPMNIRLLSNADHDVFRSFRAYDDFEGQPLHGTYLIDGSGKIRWQDIGHEPFKDVDFLLEESKRLLGL
ncbi:MAG: redoxin domain-containing protein [Pirellula sp.]|nr:peroxiredoxin family protein [Pirellula sp.]